MVKFITDTEHNLIIPGDDVSLSGLFYVPEHAQGLVIFVHGSGSSRLSPRNQYIAKSLQHAKFATLLFDLLTPQEESADNKTLTYRFDIEFLAARLLSVTRWLFTQTVVAHLPIGYFGASTGAAAALVAAATLKTQIKAVVSRGGRPDLAANALKTVQAATLLIVGGADETVIELNQQAYAQLQNKKNLTIVADAGHLFEEPGKLEEVARLAQMWFEKYL